MKHCYLLILFPILMATGPCDPKPDSGDTGAVPIPHDDVPICDTAVTAEVQAVIDACGDGCGDAEYFYGRATSWEAATCGGCFNYIMAYAGDNDDEGASTYCDFAAVVYTDCICDSIAPADIEAALLTANTRLIIAGCEGSADCPDVTDSDPEGPPVRTPTL